MSISFTYNLKYNYYLTFIVNFLNLCLVQNKIYVEIMMAYFDDVKIQVLLFQKKLILQPNLSPLLPSLYKDILGMRNKMAKTAWASLGHAKVHGSCFKKYLKKWMFRSTEILNQPEAPWIKVLTKLVRILHSSEIPQSAPRRYS